MKKQFGRSMIEMLGVLAIIGVLSIGGIALYRRAVNNHHANTILDDVNRFAFVLTESNRAFSTNAFIDNIEYSKTSTYNLDAFLGASAGQFGIVVTDVPRGVCEPLVDKASVEYKVRTLPANTADSVVQLSATGLVYDVFHKDICINDMNDVVLYFGDTSAQCNAPDEGETYAKCNSNAECCGTHFCVYVNATNGDKLANGSGQCQPLSRFNPGWFTASGQQWVHSRQVMNIHSIYSFCAALGMSVASRADVGCTGIQPGELCSSSILDKILEAMGAWGGHALGANESTTEEYIIVLISHGGDDDGGNFKIGSTANPTFALCH